MNSLSTAARFRIVLAVAILLSIGGIFFATDVSKSAQDGGRGGALAVALSFTVLFLSRGYGTKVYDILTREAVDVEANLREIRNKNADNAQGVETQINALDSKVDALISKNNIDASVQHIQNVYLAWSSGIGTLAWGFGDIAAQWLIGATPCTWACPG